VPTAWRPDDGRVVALTHGCGAHSETVVETQESSYAGMAVEDDEFDVVERVDTTDQDEEAVATVDAPEDAALPGVDDPPLDDLPLDEPADGPAPPAELAGGLADDEQATPAPSSDDPGAGAVRAGRRSGRRRDRRVLTPSSSHR
jgi:hypothetical protein